jgi:hypothetical protein
MFATIMQCKDAIRAQIQEQDDAGIVPIPTADHTSGPDQKKLALLQGTYRPPCSCDPASGPVPCDAAIIAVLSAEPVTGCPNIAPRAC